MAKEVVIIIGDEDEKFYKSLGVKPKVMLEFLNRQFVQVVREATNIYDGIQSIDEEMMAGFIVQAGINLNSDRIELIKKNKAIETEKKDIIQNKLENKKKPCPKRNKNKIGK